MKRLGQLGILLVLMGSCSLIWGNTQIQTLEVNDSNALNLLNFSQQNKQIWLKENINSAEWIDNDYPHEKSVLYAKTQVLLSRNFASPGPIDARLNLNTIKAISAYQIMNGLKVTGKLNQETWGSLNKERNIEPVFVEYTLTYKDIQQNYVQSIPTDYADQAKMQRLHYLRVSEMLAEKFHMDELFLQQINPKATFEIVGEKIIVANVKNNLPKGVSYLVAHKGMRQLILFNQENKMIAAFPATIGSEENPSPTGQYKIVTINKHPFYSYNPKNFIQGNNLKPLLLPPGPNNPVGTVWIGLSKPSFGIHGTPSPSLISKTYSHGCIRLTNWDVERLASHLQTGINITFVK
ncbi:L,D-transpeptidase family protein [Acinetobacter sp. YH16058]|uniref:L,D-transpeptidase family protein n=1 Tax=Acinetobacter sp. YH16058 TaxID=2601196 RepID=UPI00211E8C34|nr:L,D-transpeptidase family protein [Acinetobacter sp. YH16058]